MKLYSRGPYGFWEVHTALDGPRLNQSNCEFHSCYTIILPSDEFLNEEKCYESISCMCVCIYAYVYMQSQQYFDMIKGPKYGLFKTYFYSYNTCHAFPTGNLSIVKPLKGLPDYLTVASG